MLISLQTTDQKNTFRIIFTFLTLLTTMIENCHLGKDRSLSHTQKVISILKAESEHTCQIYIIQLHKLNY